MLIDLSRPITPGLPHHPYDEPLTLEQIRQLGRDGFNDWRLSTGMHAGTHIDTPGHLTEDSRLVTDFPLTDFCGEAVCLDVRGRDPVILSAPEAERIGTAEIVLFWTGHGDAWGTPGYYGSHPVLDTATADRLVERRIKLTGFDLPSPDRHPFPIHKRLFAADILILENLTGLEPLAGKRFRIYAFPLPVAADSAPVRVVAELDE